MLRIVWRFTMVSSGGVVVGYGADVTPRFFYEYFIAVMVNIDGNDKKGDAPHARVIVQINV